MTTYHITLLPGDGVGPEVTAAAQQVLETVGGAFNLDFQFSSHDFGGIAIDRQADPLPPATLSACKNADAVFLGAVGGPKWGTGKVRPEQGLLGLRKSLNLFANLRPVKLHPALAAHAPLRADLVTGVDMLIMRELTGGLYFGEKTRTEDTASDLCTYSRFEITRIARAAFAAARQRRGSVTSIDKANVLETSRLWRETVTALHEAEFADVDLRHELVDSAAMKLITAPGSYDVILTENLFGDILSDECSVLSGSIGLLGSASLGEDGGPGVFEPIHGSAPDIAGKGIANPVGAIASAAMLLRYGLKENAAANALDAAIYKALDAGKATQDLGGALSTQEMTDAVAWHIHK